MRGRRFHETGEERRRRPPRRRSDRIRRADHQRRRASSSPLVNPALSGFPKDKVGGEGLRPEAEGREEASGNVGRRLPSRPGTLTFAPRRRLYRGASKAMKTEKEKTRPSSTFPSNRELRRPMKELRLSSLKKTKKEFHTPQRKN